MYFGAESAEPLKGVSFPPARLSEEAEDLCAEVRAFLSEELADGAFEPRCDGWFNGYSPEFSRKLGKRGWLGMTWPKRYGGHERSSLERFVVLEELLAAGAPVASHWIADRQSGPSILRFGTEEQKRRFLPAIACGECFFSIGMSEPESGSDLASVQTSAERVDGGWLINGMKIWTGGAHRSHYFIVLCRTSPRSEEDRHAGLSQFIVDLSTPGITVEPIRLVTDEHVFNEVRLENVFVPDNLLLGEVGAGWEQVTSELAHERSGAERFMSTFPLLVELVRVLGEDLDEQSRITVGTLVSRLWTLRKMSLSVAVALETGAAPEVEAALVKELGNRFEREVADAARLLMPSEPSFEAPDPFRVRLAEAISHAPAFTLRGGTSEILRGIVARGLGVR
ncbi:MAG: acyl-CoA dehydrogenase family protein [Actinomycetota bacterium]|nr:acyl-CoA dehydrogenase family protein [Actinomycetota bacterium]